MAATIRMVMAVLVLWVGGCFKSSEKRPDALTLSELVADLEQSNQWSDVKLTKTAEGEFEGTAKSESDEILNLKVRQTTTGIYADWTCLKRIVKENTHQESKGNSFHEW